MKWTSHAAIARAVSHELCLPAAMEEMLREGSLDPDRNPDYAPRYGRRGVQAARVPHHHAPDWVIMKHAWSARLKLLAGDGRGAAFDLGRALHYVQDRSVLNTRYGHDSLEEAIADLTPPMDAVVLGIDRAVCSPAFVAAAVMSAVPRHDPHDAMRSAVMLSAAISAAVLGPLEPEGRLLSDLDAERARRRRGPARAALSLALVAAGIALSIIALSPWPLLAGMAAAALPHLPGLVGGRSRTELKPMADWYGITI